jgi:uncharacterized protein (UPF0276 family)
MPLLTGLSIFGDPRYRDAARPLFEGGGVDAIEWTADQWRMGYADDETAGWLKNYGDAGRLIAHGLDYPVLDAGEAADKLRAKWLAHLAQDVARHRYCGLSVHFGFSTGWEIGEGAPLPVPYCDAALGTGITAMQELQTVAKCPVGIENLALAFSQQDVADQGRFISELLAPVDGYLLLDLHNIYCQSQNFDIPMLEIIKSYPLARVVELHVAGGSWSEQGGRRIRRDTHDGEVPQDILDVLPVVAALCPNARFAMLEKLPQSFTTAEDDENFRADFGRLQDAVKGVARAAA